MKKNQKLHVENKKRLTLDDFKMKANLAQTQDALEAVTGGILGAGPDDGGKGLNNDGTSYDTSGRRPPHEVIVA